MRILATAMLMMTVSGCANVPTSGLDVFCASLSARANEHASALAENGDPAPIRTGRALIATIDAGCASI